MDSLITKLLENDKYHVEIDVVGTFQYPSNYRFNCHKHKKIEINYINNGYCIMGIECEYVYLKKGDCIIIYPGVSHFFVVDERRSCRLTQLEFFLNGMDSCDIDEELIFLNLCFNKSMNHTKLYDCNEIKLAIEKIDRNNNMMDNYKDAISRLNFIELYYIISRYIKKSQVEKSDVKNVKVKQVIKYIHENINMNLNIEEICNKHDISCRYLRKIFSENMEMNVTEYITLLRINRAKEMLQNHSLSITQIAFNTGFSSSQYFSKVFKNCTGMTAMNYREALLEKDEVKMMR